MSVVVIGLNHRSAPLDLLERMTIGDAALPKALHDLVSRERRVARPSCSPPATAPRSTSWPSGSTAPTRTSATSSPRWPSCRPRTSPTTSTSTTTPPAVAHLFAVAAGLDSAVLGESEILGQVRSAWERAREEGAAGPALNLLFRHALEVGKRARTETGIARHITSVSQAAVAMAAERLGGLAGRRVLVLGAGEMGEGMALGPGQGRRRAHASPTAPGTRAVALADRVGGRAVPPRRPRRRARRGRRAAHLHRRRHAAARARRPRAGHGRPRRPAAAHRRHRRAPRRRSRRRPTSPASRCSTWTTCAPSPTPARRAPPGRGRRRRRRIVDEELERYLGATSAREVAPLIVALRERAEEVRQAELERYRARLGELDAGQRDAVEALTRGIVGKLLHDPTVALKDAAGSARGERLAEALRDLFDLDDDDAARS